MKRLLTLTLLLMLPILACAASKQYYSYPDALRLNDTDRVLVYQNASGSRNITGATLKSSVMGDVQSQINAKAPINTPAFTGQVSIGQEGMIVENPGVIGGGVSGGYTWSLSAAGITTQADGTTSFPEISKLRGVTSPIQGQFSSVNATKADKTTLQPDIETVRLTQRKPRKVFSKLYGLASGASRLKTVVLGDSLASVKMMHIQSVLDRKFGGISASGVNDLGTTTDAGIATGGGDCYPSVLTSAVLETGQYQYYPTGQVHRIDSGGSLTIVRHGVNPTFTDIKAYFIKEPGAGTVNLVVGGATVDTESANAAIGLGILTATQATAQATVTVTATGAPVRVVLVHVSDTTKSGVDWYSTRGTGGLLLPTVTTNAQGMDIWSAILADISPDLLTFEMDDPFGDGGTGQASFDAFTAMLDSAIPLTDKVIIASTPRASDDAGKIAARNYLKTALDAKDASYLLFDSYSLMGSYADMVAIFGSDDGAHPNKAAQAYAAEVLMDYLGLNNQNLGYVPRAVNDSSTASTLARGTKYQTYSGDAGAILTVDSDAGVGYDWVINYPRLLSFGTRGTYGSINGVVAQFSGNTAVFPNVLPLKWDFGSVGSAKKIADTTVESKNYLQFINTAETTGYRNIQAGRVRAEVDVWAPAARLGTATNNTSVAADGTLSFAGTAKLPYGSMYMEDGTVTVSVALNHTYYPVASGMTTGTTSGLTFQNASELKCLTAGKYLVTWSMSVLTNQSDQTIEGLVMVNSTGQPATGNATRAKEAAVTYAVSGSGVLTLAVNDVVKLAVEKENGAASTFTVNHATMTLLHIGG